MIIQKFTHVAMVCTLGALLTGVEAQTPKSASLGKPGTPHAFTIGDADFLLDGQRLQIRCGEIHDGRIPREYWAQRLKMCKAMGLNTVCAYLFWNMHEPREGQFDWSGQADAAEFCRLAQQEGLWVILRPGPYSCAEWEMGGTPWWLLKNAPITLRSTDPKYLEPAKRYLNEVGRVLAPLQVTRGGPILMVQVENEYGFMGNDKNYVKTLRKAVIDAGFKVPLFDCNPTLKLGQGSPDDLFHVVNFGSNPKAGFAALRRIQPKGPLMCGEFYPGWFDTWGAPHHTGNTQTYLQDLETMLKNNGSFSIYMAHGGTSLGLWAGCDRPFKPDTSSYDYDAPISEAGWATEKFHKTRELLARYLLPGETLGEIPDTSPVTSFAPVTATAAASIFNNLPAPVADDTPRNMEAYNQGYGCILYRTTLPAGPADQLEVAGIADFGFVYIDQKPAGVFDRRRTGSKVRLSVRDQPVTLDILVEPMGRINFGAEMNDPKGLRAPVKFAGTELKGWQVFSLPLDSKMLAGLKYQDSKASGPAFWRATVELTKSSDTFLDLSGWGKGVIWVNGHCLGRFWNIGPTQTAYAPECWLKQGSNEIVIWDLVGPTSPVVAGLEKPILDRLRPELDFAVSRRPEVTLDLPVDKPAHTGNFATGTASQDVKFATPASGRFFCLESVDAYDGKGYAAIAELDLLGGNGESLNRAKWTIAHVSSEERTGEEKTSILPLMIWRNGITSNVELKLQVLGAYSATAPYNCPKSKAIFEQGCRLIAEKGLEKTDIPDDLNALALLASGDKKYQPMLGKYAEKVAASLQPTDTWNWHIAYGNLFLSEYALATGSKSVSPELKQTTLRGVKNQCMNGMWGHAPALSNGHSEGYGGMNQIGLPMVLSLVLARQAGVSDPALDKAIDRSVGFLRYYVDKGAIPYGDHPPWGNSHEDNGKSSCAAVLFDVLGDREATSFFSKMATAAYDEREHGHCGNFWNMLWALPAASRCGPLATGAYLKEQSWYYDLSRNWKGGFVYQKIETGDENNNYTDWDLTGGYLLSFGLYQKSLLLLGKKPSPPARPRVVMVRITHGNKSNDPKHEVFNSRSGRLPVIGNRRSSGCQAAESLYPRRAI